MPSIARPGRRGTYIELPEELFDGVHALAESNQRTFRDEVVHAIQRHLNQPPKVQVIVDSPDLKPETISRKDEPAKPKRGRPRKGG